MLPMKIANSLGSRFTVVILAGLMCGLTAVPVLAQNDAPYYPPEDLDRMVSRIALYPDPLLAQALAAATFPDQIPDAARWSDEHHYLSGDDLARAISEDQLPWDPSVQALLPFPSVLDMMARDMSWTSSIGNAFLAQQQDVMYAVQRMRRRARDFGYLRSSPQIIVGSGPYITILPLRPEFVCVPYYDPAVVYVAPRPGFFVGAAISFRFGVPVGPVFRPWGWGGNRIAWENRTVIVNNVRWQRTWVNRTTYVHPYTVRRYDAPRAAEWQDRHERFERSERERSAERWGHQRVEEHRYEAARHDDRRHDDHHDNRGHDDHGHGNHGHDDHGHGDDHGRHDH